MYPFMKKLPLMTLALAAVLFTACGGGPKKEFTYELKDVQFTFEPPYAGSDTKSADVVLDLEKVFADNGADIKKIGKVTLEKVSLQINNHDNFDQISNLKIEFVGDNVDMQTIANSPEVPKGQKGIDFPGSDKKDADKFFKAGKFSVLLTANLAPEDSNTYNISANLVFKVKAGEKK